MGATVLLFNRYDRLHEKALTDESGLFAFAGLLPDIYSIRVTLASFVPAVKSHILVQPGMRSMLNVSLANLFSSIQLVYPSAGQQRVLMNDEWKWVLRTSERDASGAALPAGVRRAAGSVAHGERVLGHARRGAVCGGRGGDPAAWRRRARATWARRSRWRPRCTATTCWR